MNKIIKKFFKPEKSKKDLEYKLQAYGGETIEEYVDRLFNHFREVSNNKLAAYAQFVSGKRSVVTGEFNGVTVSIDEKSTKKEIIDYIRKKLSMKSNNNQEYKAKKGFGKK
jgi:hypothetical protein